jgi:hypothetical protein
VEVQEDRTLLDGSAIHVGSGNVFWIESIIWRSAMFGFLVSLAVVLAVTASPVMADDASFARWLATPGGQHIEAGAAAGHPGLLKAYRHIVEKHCGIDSEADLSAEDICPLTMATCRASLQFVYALPCDECASCCGGAN